ncbi:hypothetical protein L6452_21722 [Arctium lappa]|uniref:Uncharacterized protein n=1 Tax=Arctium lappa TaxID=4217 RepID=A0ACB9AY64_ARCLA|nr:hypothetical protein L6452_21722 [Arctium lappa]
MPLMAMMMETIYDYAPAHKEIKMSNVAKTIRGWSFRDHADGYSNGNDGYYYLSPAKLQGDGDDDDADYDYAPAASEGDGDDDDGDYDFAPAA